MTWTMHPVTALVQRRFSGQALDLGPCLYHLINEGFIGFIKTLLADTRLANAPGETTGDGSSTWAPVAHMGEPDEVPGP